jgi:plastocyanin
MAGVGRRWRLGVIAGATLLGLGTAFGPTSAGAAAEVQVGARDDFFDGVTAQVDTGGRVTWTNNGHNPHNVVADDGSFVSTTINPGQSFTQRFPKQGEFKYFCSFHGARGGKGMSGVVFAGEKPENYSSSSQTRSYPNYPPPRPPLGKLIHVPADKPTIQAGVDAAQPGDIVLVAPGVYEEAVRVTTSGITIRGQDRSTVILDGGFKVENKNGIAVFAADGVSIENMTARHYQLNGFYWRSVWGYRGSYLTAYDNGDYGIYAFDSGFGMFDHDLASGHPDSGFYIGQCRPCNALITNVKSTNNAIGYSGTNAGGNLIIRDSEFANNMGGIVPNTLDTEALAPQRGALLVGNWVHDNHNRSAPAKSGTYAAFGNGIVLAGGSDNEVAYNLVENHPYAGIASAPNVDKNLWIGSGNRIHDNTVGQSGVGDLVLAGPAAGGNCFSNNHFQSSLPPAIEVVYGCGSPISGVGGGDLGTSVFAAGYGLRATTDFPHGDWKVQPEPAAQPGMPDVTVAPAVPGPSAPLDIASELASDRAEAMTHGAGQAGVVLAAFPSASLPSGTGWPGNILFTLLGYGLPLLLIAGLVLRLGSRGRSGPRRGLSRTRTLVLLPVAYVALTLVVVGLGYLGLGA